MSPNRTIVPVLILALILSPIVGKTQNNASESDDTWTEKAVAEATGGGWFEGVKGQLPEAGRVRAAGATIRIERRSFGLPPACLDPRNLAYTDLTRSGPVIVICSNNFILFYNALYEIGRASLLDPAYLKSLPESYPLVDYVDYLTRQMARQSLKMRQPSVELDSPCSFLQLRFWRERHGGTLCSYKTVVNADFEAWRDRNNPGWNQVLLALWRNLAITKFSKKDRPEGDADRQVASWAADVMSRASEGLLTRLTVLHELGHIALGHLEQQTPSGCDLVRQEVAADGFAMKYMKKLQFIETESDMQELLIGYVILEDGLEVAEDSEGKQNPLAEARMKASMVNAIGIIDLTSKTPATNAFSGWLGVSDLSKARRELSTLALCD